MAGDGLTGGSGDYVAEGCERPEKRRLGQVSHAQRYVSVPKYLLRIAERAKTAKKYVEELFVSK